MMKRLLITVACLLPFAGNAVAGWYQVDNYEGELGKSSIQFSMQTYDFGSGITVEGSYYDKAGNSPIALYGKISGTKVQLCEISNDEELDRVVVQGSTTPFDTSKCPISLTLSDDGATGTWKKGGSDHPVVLRKIASLDDTAEANIDGNVAIPFWAQTDTHMFRGIYTNTSNGLCMEKVEIVNKSTGHIDQEIAFANDVCNAGMVMTPIYMNIQKWVDAGVDIMSVNFLDNRGGYSEDYAYDKASRNFSKAK